MNVSIINLKAYTKNITKLIFIIIIFFFIRVLLTQISLLQKIFTFEKCSFIFTSFFSSINEQDEKTNNLELLKINYPILAYINNEELEVPQMQKNEIKEVESPIIIPTVSQVEPVSERNIEESYNYMYDTIKIKNQSDYDITDSMFSLDDVQFNNKKIIIYHTHTCESYTPSEKYNYTMTGNYRTTDLNYSVARVYQIHDEAALKLASMLDLSVLKKSRLN